MRPWERLTTVQVPILTFARLMPVLDTPPALGKYIRFQWVAGIYLRGQAAIPVTSATKTQHNQWNFYTVDDRKIGYGLKPYNPILIQ